jgi:hypothetical protein
MNDIVTLLLALALLAVAVRGERTRRRLRKMATREEFDAVVGKFNEATNAIAARITKLEGTIAGAGLSAEAEATVLAELHAVADGLKALGADPSNPVPEPVPMPEVPTDPK